ncbi:MAG: outer membrane lipoprotein carrier protein LolA [Bdellovibrionota bacterium]
MRRLVRFIACLLAQLLLTQVATAQDAPILTFRSAAFECRKEIPSAQTTNLLADIERHYEQIGDLTASFSQSSYFVGSEEEKISRGKIYFKRPGKMDWVYEAPEIDRFVSDGTTLWIFNSHDNQVRARSFRDSFSSDVPVSFLLGVGKLRENFKLISACESSDGVVLKLEPLKPNDSLNELSLLVDGKSHAPIGASVMNVGGNQTAILFENMKLNTSVPESHFAFQIPKGSDFIDERASVNGGGAEEKK